MNQLEVKTSVGQYDPRDGDELVVEILVDEEPLTNWKCDLLAVDLAQLHESAGSDGEFFMVTCTCGDAGCAGIDKGITVRHESSTVYWEALGSLEKFSPARTYSFDLQEYQAAIARGLTRVRELMQETGKEPLYFQREQLADLKD